ncbi:MAG: hypothetical protein H0W73_10780 [Bacteroidetes bacterium]|nr:hypothetical protein [Bacteroidota bacterium]
MENKKILTTLLVSTALSGFLYLKLTHAFVNKLFEYGNDILIVILLLAFAEEILLLIFLTPFALYQKLSALGNSHINESQQEIIQNTNPQKI